MAFSPVCSVTQLTNAYWTPVNTEGRDGQDLVPSQCEHGAHIQTDCHTSNNSFQGMKNNSNSNNGQNAKGLEWKINYLFRRAELETQERPLKRSDI